MSWEQLAAMYRENADARAQEAEAPPVACPNDGTPLESGPDGVLHCVFDGWTWDGFAGSVSC